MTPPVGGIAGSPEPNTPSRGVPVVNFAITGELTRTMTGDRTADRAIVRATRRRPQLGMTTVAPLASDPEIVTTHPSFDDFYQAHRSSIGRALAVTLRDADLASEAVDEAMARAYQRWPHVRTLDNPGGWVYRVGLNWSRSFLRRSRRPAPPWIAGQLVSPGPMVMDPSIDRALGELSVDQRAVVVCRFLIGYSEAQTAAALGLRPGTVKSRLSRALDRLRVLLDGLQPDHHADDTHHETN
jgi:DNA-directed RNA polymerase specialized sigma24 family protein